MTGSAHRHCELRKDSCKPAKGTRATSVSDGPGVDYKGMQATAAREAASRGGKGVEGQSGSEILDYQDPIQNKRGRSRNSDA